MSRKRQTRKQLPAGHEDLDELANQDLPPHPTVSDAAEFGGMPTLVGGEGGDSVGGALTLMSMV